jgi:hypothetical protein
MSTLTQPKPGTAVQARLLSVPLAVTFLAEFTSLTSFFLLLSVMPMLAAAAGALWNFAYDAGYGAGPAAFGLICVRTGYPVAFALSGVLILAAVPVALRERKAVASVARPA